MFSTTALAALLLSALPLSLASPSPVHYNTSGIAIHLSNCCLNGTDLSQILYYLNDTASYGHAPISVGVGTIENTKPNQFVHWAGSKVVADFPDGFSITANVTAGVHPVGSYAGPAANSAGQQFRCYKDDDRIMFDEEGESCRSVYVCPAYGPPGVSSSVGG